MPSPVPRVSTLVKVPISVIKFHDQKKTWGGKSLFYLSLLDNSPLLWEVRAETQAGKNLEAGTEAEAMAELCLLVCSSGLFSLL